MYNESFCGCSSNRLCLRCNSNSDFNNSRDIKRTVVLSGSFMHRHNSSVVGGNNAINRFLIFSSSIL